jgi:hypothetical protein
VIWAVSFIYLSSENFRFCEVSVTQLKKACSEIFVKSRHHLQTSAKTKMDLSFMLFLVVISICFVGLSIVVFGWIIGTDLFLLGFNVVLCGLIVGIVDAVLTLVGVFGKA